MHCSHLSYVVEETDWNLSRSVSQSTGVRVSLTTIITKIVETTYISITTISNAVKITVNTINAPQTYHTTNMTSPILPSVRTNLAAFTSQVTGPLRRYAILFNEGPGYLLVDGLSSGAYGVTMLVLSLGDKQVYVRKLHKAANSTGESNYQVEDEKFTIDHSNVPRLMTSKYYHQIVLFNTFNLQGDEVSNPTRVTIPVTTWQFCNGGEVNDISEAWSDGFRDKIPEPVIWHWLAQMLDVHLTMSRQGVAHRDNHERNLILHWQAHAVMPDLFLMDFGLGQRLPRLQNPAFLTPFTGTFTPLCLPVSSADSDQDKQDIKKWYANVVQDFKNLIQIFQHLIFAGRTDRFVRVNSSVRWIRQMAMITFFKDHASQNQGINGYSSELVQAISTVSGILDVHWAQPPTLLAKLSQSSVDVQERAQRRASRFLSQPQQARQQTNFMRTDSKRSSPAMWEDASSLRNPVPIGRLLMNRNEQAIQLLNPAISIDGGGLDTSVYLRQRNFRIVELAYDQDTHNFQIVSILAQPDENPDQTGTSLANPNTGTEGNADNPILISSGLQGLPQGARADDPMILDSSQSPSTQLQVKLEEDDANHDEEDTFDRLRREYRRQLFGP